MPEVHDNAVGSIVNISFNRGDTHRRIVYLYGVNSTTGAEEAVTPAAARMTFKDDTYDDPGAAVSGLTVTPTIDTGTVTYELTPTMTRLFTAGRNYCYSLEVDDADGRTQTIHKGNVQVDPEIAT